MKREEDNDISDVDLLADNEGSSEQQQQQSTTEGQQQEQQQQHASGSSVRTPPGPPSSSLFDKLGDLEKRWTDKTRPSTRKQTLPWQVGTKKGAPSMTIETTTTPTTQNYHQHPPTTTPRSSIGNVSVDGSISPLTVFGDSPMGQQQQQHGFAPAGDEQSLSTYGSLGSPGNVHRLPPTPQLFHTARQQPKKTTVKKESFFERMHRGEKRNIHSLQKKPSSAHKLMFGSFKSPPAAARPPKPGTVASIPEQQQQPQPPIGSKKRAAFSSSNRSVGSRSRASRSPLPPTTPVTTSRTSKARSSQQQTPYYSATSRPGGQQGNPKSPSSTSIFDRLYRRERRNTSLWTDPCTKEDSTYKFVASGGASKTSMISIYHQNSVATPSVPRKLNFLHAGTMDGNMSGRMATAIQQAVRYHQAQSRLVGHLVQAWSVQCHLPVMGEDDDDEGGIPFIPTKNRILGLKYQVLARATAIQQVDTSQLEQYVTIHETSGGTASLSHTIHVSFPAWDDANCIVQQSFAVTVECDTNMVAASRSWSHQKLGYMLHHHALEASYHAYTDKLIREAANLLKQWFFTMMYQKRKHSSEQASPTNSATSDNSMQRRIDTFNSLSWFHRRLRTETTSARQETLDFAAIVLQRNFRKVLAQRYCRALQDVHDLQGILSRRFTEDVLEGAVTLLQRTWRQVTARKQFERTREGVLRMQAYWRSYSVRKEIQSSSAQALQGAWRQRFYQRQDLNSSVEVIQSFWRMFTARRRHRQLLNSVVIIQALERRRQEQLQFYIILYGVLRLQALWRSWYARQQVNAMTTATTATSVLSAWQKRRGRQSDVETICCIQALFRMHVTRMRYHQTLRCSVRIQATWRSFQVRSRSRVASFAAVTIQSAWMQRRGATLETTALAKIQAMVRMRAAKKTYQLVLRSITKMQALERMRSQSSKYQSSLRCFIQLQSTWRSWHIRQTSYALAEALSNLPLQSTVRSRCLGNRFTAAAQRIQSAARMQMLVGVYQRKRQRVILIQAAQRRKSQQAQFRHSIDSVVCMQALWRASRVRHSSALQTTQVQLIQRAWRRQRRTQCEIRAATRIQAVARAYLATFSYRRIRLDRLEVVCTRIQSWWRMTVLRIGHLVLADCAIKIQAWWRMTVTQRNFKQLSQCAPLLSPTTVSHMTSKMHESTHVWGSSPIRRKIHYRTEAALSIQRWWRHHRSRLLNKRQFQMAMQHWSRTASKIQAFYRRHKRKQATHAVVLLQQRSARTIQSAFKGYLSRHRLDSYRRGARTVQRAWKSYTLRLSYLEAQREEQNAAVSIQTLWRAVSKECRYRNSKKAACTVQAVFRLYYAREAYFEVKAATLCVQSTWRAFVARNRYKELLCAVSIVQKVWRFSLQQKSQAMMATRIQCRFRTQKAQLYRQRHLAAAKMVQLWSQSVLCRIRFRRFRQSLLLMQIAFRARQKKRAAITIQSFWQNWIWRQERTRAASRIQQSWRTYFSWVVEEVVEVNLKATKIQSIVRRMLAQTLRDRRLNAALLLQSFWLSISSDQADVRLRGSLMVLESAARRRQLIRQKISAVMIQTLWRRIFYQRLYDGAKHSARVIQRNYRMFQPRQAFITIRRLVLVLQPFLRACPAAREFKVAKRSTVVLQRFWRGYRDERRQSSALILQKVWRMFPPRQAFIFLRRNSVRLQAFARVYLARSRFTNCKRAAFVVQCAWRQHQKRSIEIQRRQAQAFSRVQAQLRGGLARTRLQHWQVSATVIQCFQRRVVARLCFARQQLERYSAIRMQTLFRGYYEREAFHHLRHAAVLLQAFQRMRHLRSQHCSRRRSATRIQAALRKAQMRYVFLRTLEATRLLQTVWRHYLKIQFLRVQREREIAAVLLQTRYRCSHAQREFRKASLSAILLQSAIRRHRVLQTQKDWSLAAGKIQRAYANNKHRLPRHKASQASVVLQRTVRAWISTKNTATLEMCSTMIPSRTLQKFSKKTSGRVWGSRIRRLLQDRVDMATYIQTWWRLVRQRADYSRKKSSSVRIQRWARHGVLPTVRMQQAAVIRIQAWWRVYLAQSNFALLVACTAVISSGTREKMAAKIQGSAWGSRVRKQLQGRSNSALAIQQYWRMYTIRLAYREQKQSATLLQKQWRRVLPILSQEKASARKVQLWWKVCTAQGLFKKQKATSIRVQSIWRMSISKSNFQRQKTGCLRLQSQWRIYRAKATSHNRKLAGLALQAWWRMTARKNSYKRFYSSILILQALTKFSVLLKAKQQARNGAAVQIQSRWRVSCCRFQYTQKQRSAIVIQRELQKEFLPRAKVRLQSAVKLQSFWRMALAQGNFIRLRLCTSLLSAKTLGKMTSRIEGSGCWGSRIRNHLHKRSNSALTIQQCWLGYIARSEYKEQKKSAILLQREWRQVLSILRQQRLSAKQLQSRWRMYLAQSLFRKQRTASVKVQTIWRTYCAKTSFVQQLLLAKQVQSWWRMYLAQSKFKRQRTASVKLQTLWRTRHVKTSFEQQLSSAKQVQSLWRMNLAQFLFRKQRAASVKLQTLWRTYCAKTNFEQKLLSAKQVQSLWRMYVAQRMFQRQRTASVKLQTLWKTCRAKTSFEQQLLSAKLVQSWWRMYVAQRMFNRQRAASVKLQTLWRTRHVKTIFEQQLSSAKQVQSLWRTYVAQRMFKRQRAASVQLQALWRTCCAKELLYNRYEACVRLQAWSRSCMLKQSYGRFYSTILFLQALAMTKILRQAKHQERQHMVAMSIQLQSLWRMNVVRCIFLEQREASLTLQKSWKRFVCLKCYRKQRLALLTIQKSYRKYQSRQSSRNMQELQSVVLLQSAFRSKAVRRNFVGQKVAATLVQTLVRGYFMRQHLLQCRTGAQILQRNWKGYQQRQQKATQARNTEHATRLQAVARGLATRQYLHGLCSAAVTVQRNWRGHFSRKSQSHQQFVQAVTLFQSFWRARPDQLGFLYIRQSTICIQACFRMHHARKHFKGRKLSVLRLQQQWRSYAERKRLLQDLEAARARSAQKRKDVLMVTKIQQHIRMRQAQRRLRQEIQASKTLQRWTRMTLSRKLYISLKLSVIALQTHWRTLRAEKQLFCMKLSACIIQAVFRRYMHLQRYRLIRSAVVKLQRTFQGHRVKQRLAAGVASQLLQEKSAICIQKQYRRFQLLRRTEAAFLLQFAYRTHRQHSSYLASRVSASTIQTSYRRHLQQTNYLKILNAVLILQTATRSFLARNAAVLHREVRDYQGAEIKVLAIARIQGAWKGAVSRVRFNRAACDLQAAYRAHRQRKRLGVWKAGARRIQRMWRQHVLVAETQQTGACTLQRYFRGIQTRKYLEQQDLASVIIQQYWRRTMCKLGYQRRLAQLSLDRRQQCAVLVQASWRMVGQRKDYLVTRTSARLLQSHYRRHLQVVTHSRYCKATIAIQSITRGHLARLAQAASHISEQVQKVTQHKSATLIQSTWRRFDVYGRVGGTNLGSATALVKALEELVDEGFYPGIRSMVLSSFMNTPVGVNRLLSAILVIQGWIKAQQASLRFQKKRKAAYAIQRTFIGWRLSNVSLLIESSAILMKRSFRGQLPRSAAYFALREVNEELKSDVFRFATTSKEDWEPSLATCRHFASILIQRAMQKECVKKKAHKFWKAQFQSAVETTAMPVEFASWVLMFEAYFEFQNTKKKARVIQNWFRRTQSTSKIQDQDSVVKIQCWVRYCRAREVLAVLKLERNHMMRATRLGHLIGAELETIMSRKVYTVADGASCVEVHHLLSHDETSLHSSGICLRRLAKRVVLGKLNTQREQNRVREAQAALEFERTSLLKANDILFVKRGPATGHFSFEDYK